MILRCILVAALLATPALARAEDRTPVVLRFIGAAPTAGDYGPGRFVIDAAATPGDQGGMVVKGWLGAFPPQNDYGEITGNCSGRHCELTAEIQGRDFVLSGDLLGAAGPVDGAFAVKGDGADGVAAKGAARFTPAAGPIAELGTLAEPGAVDSRTLDELLLWQDIDPVFGDDETHPLEEAQHEHIAMWQQSAGRPMNGLLFAEELAVLKAKAAEAQRAAGWTPLGSPGEGWVAGYPAALLARASQAGAERRFESIDGKASLVVAFDPPMSDDAFDAFVDRTHEDAKAASDPDGFSFTRTGPDMQYAYVKGEQAVEAVFYHRKRGLARLVYTHPKGEGPLSQAATPITGSLRVIEADTPAP